MSECQSKANENWLKLKTLSAWREFSVEKIPIFTNGHTH